MAPSSSSILLLIHLLLLGVLLASFLTGIDAFLVEVIQHDVLVVLRPFIHLPWQKCRQSLNLFLGELLPSRHLYLKLDDQVALGHVVLKHRHS